MLVHISTKQRKCDRIFNGPRVALVLMIEPCKLTDAMHASREHNVDLLEHKIILDLCRFRI